MSITIPVPKSIPTLKRENEGLLAKLDPVILITSLCLLAIGLVMVTSASISVADRNLSSPFYYAASVVLYCDGPGYRRAGLPDSTGAVGEVRHGIARFLIIPAHAGINTWHR